MTNTMKMLVPLLLTLALVGDAHAEAQARVSVALHATEDGRSSESARLTQSLLPRGDAACFTLGMRQGNGEERCPQPFQWDLVAACELDDLDEGGSEIADDFAQWVPLEQLWRVGVRVVSLTEDEIELELLWKRFEWPGTRAVLVEKNRQKLSYRLEGREIARVGLDVLSPEPVADCDLESLRLVLETEHVPLPEVSDYHLMVDVSYVEGDSVGISSANTLYRTKHGEPIPLVFPKPDWPTFFDSRGRYRYQRSLVGKLVARAREDGTIELAVDVERQVSVRRDDGTISRGRLQGGEKVFRVEPGERVALELPPETGGFHGFDGDESLYSDEPLDVSAWEVVVDSRQFHVERRERLHFSVRRVGPGPTVMPTTPIPPFPVR
ncbi:MAG: hypothetical protein AAF533_11055 [Acidobacteriota bacterium]